MRLRKKRSCAKKAARILKGMHAREEKIDQDLKQMLKMPPAAENRRRTSSTRGYRTTRICMTCSVCDLAIFQSRSDKDVCQCGPDGGGFYGCFWQEVDDGDGSSSKSSAVVHTFACFRIGDRSFWSKARSKKGKGSEVKMVLGFPGVGKMRFEPDEIRKFAEVN